ncbi:DUF3574 domain-containing protein [Pseudoalteromonas luteoviolacea]|uniref:DUF3574 domain-containing protein n=1 Tax=Pseudoalteromonas luteoviolacea S4054 TaxID=1129367 RepID=A0A0F6A6S1_9GAMM|nr:DUF3574 domain-containing protein [Pseudoalteromonas luteoviolacea]AOT08173.1 hypothetical protein S4054249_10105 [Pseudoalteromonas luteoviolacea]AOT13090.1 hypothetical protein S40542_10105 [Pseudoalteromonas luteoviolacea]AOT18002.1 hypothetical protein S4054_10100 [Pseudoalteromonas luteoviolacea]KKE81149.1 hypothetical protein N479_23615 [Pseudoalteromonas luteoviolacea S4054]KZN65788.1 hypothetical protein N481_24960 [Pseudoalteromonas luteoviolacea S4047-1]
MRTLGLSFYIAILLMTGCAGTGDVKEQSRAATVTKNVKAHSEGLKMYFGLSIPSGGHISAAQWQHFESTRLAKAFAGFSVVDAVGYYKGKKEHTKVVTVYNASAEDIAAANELAKQYSQLFNQDSVLIALLNVSHVSFVGKE